MYGMWNVRWNSGHEEGKPDHHDEDQEGGEDDPSTAERGESESFGAEICTTCVQGRQAMFLCWAQCWLCRVPRHGNDCSLDKKFVP